jgi:hypothetical protein
LEKWQFKPVEPHELAVDTPDRLRFEKLVQKFEGIDAYSLRQSKKLLA